MLRSNLSFLAAFLCVATAVSLTSADEPKPKAMSANKQTVTAYMDAFNKLDHRAILDCLTDDVEWVIPGAVRLSGKQAFDKEIENPAFTGRPTIRVTRLIEENDIVVAEGTVRTMRKTGEVLQLEFCDVFEMKGGKIKRLISYLAEVKDAK